jgi:hypothetical protein
VAKPATAEPDLDVLERTLRLQEDNARYLAGLDADGRRAQTEKARRTLMEQIEAEVDPDGTLDPEERAYRAKHLRRAKLAEISRLGVQARIRKRDERLRAEESAEMDALVEAAIAAGAVSLLAEAS